MGKVVKFQTDAGEPKQGNVIAVSNPTGRSRQRTFLVRTEGGRTFAAQEKTHRVKFL